MSDVEQHESVIPLAGAVWTHDEWRVWKLVTYPDGHVQEKFMSRGASPDEALEMARGISGGGLPSRWLVQQVHVCQVFGPAQEVT